MRVCVFNGSKRGLKNSMSAHTLQKKKKKASLENNVGMCF